MLYLFFWIIPGVWILYANVSGHCYSISIGLWRWNRQCVPKRWHTKFRRRGITQKKAYKFPTALNQSNTDPGHHVTSMAEFYMKVPSISGYSVWNLLPITHLPPVILRQILYFRKIRGPLLYAHVSHNYITRHITTSHTLYHYHHCSLSKILNDS